MSDSNRFSEEQAAAIMKRAAKMQATVQNSSTANYVELEDLQKIAQEAGIDPNVLALAIYEEQAPLPEKGHRNSATRVIPGELDQSDFDMALSGLDPSWRRGMVSQVGKTLQGYVQTGLGQAHVTVTSRKGFTTIQVKSLYWMSFFLTCYPFLIFAFVAGINLGVRGEFLWMTLALTILPAIGALIFWQVHKRWEKKLADGIEAICKGVADHVKPVGIQNSPSMTDQSVADSESQNLHQRLDH